MSPQGEAEVRKQALLCLGWSPAWVLVVRVVRRLPSSPWEPQAGHSSPGACRVLCVLATGVGREACGCNVLATQAPQHRQGIETSLCYTQRPDWRLEAGRPPPQAA